MLQHIQLCKEVISNSLYLSQQQWTIVDYNKWSDVLKRNCHNLSDIISISVLRRSLQIFISKFIWTPFSCFTNLISLVSFCVLQMVANKNNSVKGRCDKRIRI